MAVASSCNKTPTLKPRTVQFVRGKCGTPWSEKLAGAVAAIVHFMTASEADSAPMERGRNEKGETEDAALDEINNKAVKKVNPWIPKIVG